MAKYYSLMIKTDDTWHGPEFGSYDQDECKYEAFDYITNGSKARIVTSGDRQKEITNAIAMFHLGTLPRP